MSNGFGQDKPQFTVPELPQGEPKLEAIETMRLRRVEFHDLTDRVERIKTVAAQRQKGGTMGFNWGIACVSLAAGSLLTYVSVIATTNEEPWVHALLVSATVFFLLMGGLCWLWHRDARGRVDEEVDVVLVYMRKMDQRYSWPSEPPPTSS